jgi:hypothetical protein
MAEALCGKRAFTGSPVWATSRRLPVGTPTAKAGASSAVSRACRARDSASSQRAYPTRPIGVQPRLDKAQTRFLLTARASCITKQSPRKPPAPHESVHCLAENVLDRPALLNGKHLQALPALLAEAKRHPRQHAVGAVRADSTCRGDSPDPLLLRQWRRLRL